jgi:hypothetical protein
MMNAREGPKHLSNQAEFVLAALAQGGLMDWIRDLNAGWRAFTAIIVFNGLKGLEKRPCRVIEEHLAVADISGQHGIAGVTRLRSDLPR